MESNNIHIDLETLKKLKEERNRKKLQIRIAEGIKQLIKRPIKIIPVALLTTLFLFLLSDRNNILPFNRVKSSIFNPVFGYIEVILIITVFLVFYIGLITLIGTPFKARSIENSLMVAFSASELRYGSCPILIAREHVKGNVTKMEFYSKIGRHIWEKRKLDIEGALNCTFLEGVQYGKDRNRIVIYITPGLNSSSRGVLIDEELCRSLEFYIARV